MPAASCCNRAENRGKSIAETRDASYLQLAIVCDHGAEYHHLSVNRQTSSPQTLWHSSTVFAWNGKVRQQKRNR